MPSINIELEGLEQAQRKLSLLDDDARGKAKIATGRAVFKVQRLAKQNAPVDTGRLRADIHAHFIDELQGVIFNTVTYAPYQHFGTEAGHFPPPQALEIWAMRHGMVGLEFPIAQAISREGLQATPYLMDAFEEVEDDYIREIQQIMENLS